MARPKPDKIEELQDANDRLHQLANVYQLPFIEPVEFVDTVLAMGNRLPTTQEKADAYHLYMRGHYIGDSYEWSTSDFCETPGSNYGVGKSDLEPASISEVGQSGLTSLVSTQATLEREIAMFWEKHADQRSQFRKMLDLVYGGKSEETKTYLRRNYKNVVQIHTMDWTGLEPKPTTRYCLIDIHGFLAYALALIVNPRTNLSKYLRVCNLESCDNYFLSTRMPRNKKRNLKYCGDAHTKEGNAKKHAKSQAISRKKIKGKKAKTVTKRAKR